MIVRTRIFELSESHFNNLSELAEAMEISVSQIYRVREGKRHINQKFIVGAMKAFPDHNLDDLFYLTPELPAVTNKQTPQPLTSQTTDRSTAKEISGIAGKVLI